MFNTRNILGGELCSDSAFYPHKSPSMPPLPPCLTIQFYSSNQLLFPVIIPISSSSIHLLASFTINLPLLFLFDEFGNFSSFLFAYINMYFISISQLVSHSSTTALIVVSLTPCSLHVKQDSKARIVHVGWIEQQLFRTSFIRTPWNWCFLNSVSILSQKAGMKMSLHRSQFGQKRIAPALKSHGNANKKSFFFF